jgi:hypothetical protein
MSPSHRILAPVGLAPADFAALAALVAQVPVAQGAWRIGDVSDADLVLVDLDTTDGVIGQADAITQDIPCVALDVPGGLARPLSVDALAAVLANVPARSPRVVVDAVVPPPPSPAAQSERYAAETLDAPITRGTLQFGLAEPDDDADMPFDQLFSPDLVGRIPDGNAGSATGTVEPMVPVGPEVRIEDVPSGGPASGDVAVVAPGMMDATVPVVEASAPPVPVGDGEDGSVPSAANARPTSPPGDAGVAKPAPALAAVVPKPAAPKASYPLVEYLTGKLIGLPSRVAPGGLPAIVLDPQRQVFHAEGDLAALAPYFDLLLSRTQWLAVLPSQLADVRVRVPGRPYAVLRFSHALRSAGRSLASHLDPGGTYALRGELPLEADLPRVQRVLAALAAPRGLAEIASQSGTSVVEVYEVVSALDAIGQLAWTPRKRPGAR